MDHNLKIETITEVTHNVRCIRLQKPSGFLFTPGHAADVSINKRGWVEEKRPFTFTCLNDDPYLEFTIKCYEDHDGVTNQVRHLKPGDEMIVSDPWGAIEYKGEGCFIAGGAGITPFIAILRQLGKEGRLANNKLFFSNKTPDDIIYEQELTRLLGDNAVHIITDTNAGAYRYDYIDEAFLTQEIKDFNQHFYVCGPDKMIADITQLLLAHGAGPETVVFEK